MPARGDHVQTWATPPYIVDAIGLPFDLDCCAQPHTAKVQRHYAIERGEDGMRLPWLDATWCNPPYAEQDRWLARAAYFGTLGVRVACLVLASTSSLYWRPLTFECGTVDFYEGRIAFLDDDGVPNVGASFSSALVLYGPGFAPNVVRIRSAATGHLIGEPMQRRLL